MHGINTMCLDVFVSLWLDTRGEKVRVCVIVGVRLG